MGKKSVEKRSEFKKRDVALAALSVAALLFPGAASAVKLEMDNPDLDIRWDNTVRYNAGVRAEDQDSRINNNPVFDESNMKFDKGDLVTNRLDLLSEFDFVYKKTSGFRVSASAWYDQAYHDDTVRGNPAFGSQNTYPGNRYTDFVKRYNKGLSGEILDAFVFTKFDVGGAPVGVKLGRHNVFWGESLFSLGNGIAYSQGPIDVRKALANPGTEVKELFLPLGQLSAQAQVTSELSVAAQYYYEWKPWRLPDGGTYFGGADFFSAGGGTNLALGPGFSIPFTGIGSRPKDRGDWGVMAKWAPEWLNGTVGFYYREFGEKLPWAVLNPAFTDAHLVYNDNVKLYGISLSKLLGDTSVGAELSYRKGGAFNSAFAPGTAGARGDSIHWLVNAVQYFGENAAWDSAVLIAEINGSHWRKVTSNAGVFQAEGTAACPGDKMDGCVTKNNVGINLKLEPLWYQVVPGVDLKMPLVFGIGIKGNGATLGGNREKNGSYSVGLAAEIQQRHFVTLSYNDYMVKFRDNGTAVTTDNGGGALYKDRGWVSLTYKTAF
ncbi:DUF1302 domain-containing protein [Noviherbaspirillum sedimenti]|uniref:DUF1302 domain-containing protein n=1 Tax=Noviherbaspirillum sedimenti TaxID=2320865 RepID=A0A3A3G3U4_9BURK|nr:DUF1302 domain-containing protein [Noviherbaspirillum sedimenti]RJG03157.1 DUF1302 domain-containing protein [Noviherbaspirillum sedimenti]